MRFASPSWLWALCFLPGLVMYYSWEAKKNQKLFSQWISRNLWLRLIPEFKSQKTKKGLSLLGCLFLILALARPQFGSHEELLHSTGLDIFIALDVSTSMNVEDAVPSRIQAAKHMIRSLADHSQGNRMGIVAFAGSSYVASPLTNDLNYFLKTVELLSPRTIQNQGTDIGSALMTASEALQRGGEENAREVPSHVLILISDGEDLEGEALKAAEEVKKRGIKFYALGVGTEKGGPIPLRDSNGNLQTYKKNTKGQPITSTFSSRALSQIAEKAAGKYWTVTSGEPELQELVKDLNQLSRGEFAERRYQVQEERYQIPLFIAIVLLVSSLAVSRRKELIFCLALFSSVDLSAGVPLESYWKNKKGMEALQSGNLSEAQQNFGAAQALSPSNPELRFNQGVVEFSTGKLDAAVESFEDAYQKADKNDSLKGKARYNLGNTYAEQKKISEAVRSYAEAIQVAQRISDPILEVKARKNLQLLIEPPKQDQKKSDQKQDQKKEDNQSDQKSQNKSEDQSKDSTKDKKDSKDQTGDQSKDKSKNESRDELKDESKDKPKDPSQKSDDEPQKKDEEKPEERKSGESPESPSDEKQNSEKNNSKQNEFRSEKMKPEDAERVMAELTNREKELQEKLHMKNANGKNRATHGSKDW